jgi:hypothetical protein
MFSSFYKSGQHQTPALVIIDSHVDGHQSDGILAQG